MHLPGAGKFLVVPLLLFVVYSEASTTIDPSCISATAGLGGAKAAQKTSFTDMGFHRFAAVSPKLVINDPMANAEIMLEYVKKAAANNTSVVTFPELGLTGYTAEDLLLNEGTLKETRKAIRWLADQTKALNTTIVVGAPFQTPDGRMYNCAFVIAKGKVVGAVPKINLPNYAEFYERRWFIPGGDVNETVNDPILGKFKLSPKQIFKAGEMNFGIEICEDLWAPNPPSTNLALAGAHVIVNLSASNDLVGKPDFRRELVKQQAARINSGYVYVSSGPWESTKDTVFGGHSLVAEDGSLLGESPRMDFDGTMISHDIDVNKILHERRRNTTFGNTPKPPGYETVNTRVKPELTDLDRKFSPTPFVPTDPAQLKKRFEEIIEIQSTALVRRMKATGSKTMVLGISGGLDSTQAALVMLESAKKLGWTKEQIAQNIVAVSMPGPGTSQKTRDAAKKLAEALGFNFREIDINASVAQHLKDLGHDGETEDITYENAQARERTQILFDLSNKVGGIVVGTGDMSELWLGWCTYNGDHMASYGVNAGIPKTLIRHLVRSYAQVRAEGPLKEILLGIADTTISPELKKPKPDGQISQSTEDVVGPYALHDFFLFHHLRSNFEPKKIYELAKQSFKNPYPVLGRDGYVKEPGFTPAEIKKWLKVFYQRGFISQFKRTTLPAGPKIGSVSVSPRADLRMPDEAAFKRILAEIDALPD